jgi:hypothetical protein
MRSIARLAAISWLLLVLPVTIRAAGQDAPPAPPTRPSAQKPLDRAADGWKALFDGKSLAGWKRTDFAGGGEVRVERKFRGGDPAIVVEAGSTLSGLNYTGQVPRTDYEVALEALKIEGSDFLLGLTFPVGDSYASLIVGGWGGSLVGISSIDSMDASENETTKYMSFPKDRWYRVRLRVTTAKLEAWLDDKPIVNQVITGRKINLRYGEIRKSVPLGIATYQTAAAYRAIKLKRMKDGPPQ